MAWTDLSFPSGSKLTSTKMTEVQSNFAALAAGEAGAPPLAVNSLMWSGVASGAFLNVSSGLQTTEAGSFGSINAAGGIQTTEVGSFGSLDVSSGLVLAAAPSTPPANEAFRESVAKAWITFDGTGTISIATSFNVATITDNGLGDYTITWDTDFTLYSLVGTAKNNGSVSIGFNINPIGGLVAGTARIATPQMSNGTPIDSPQVCCVAFGDQ